jgi:hypothetical protein
MEVVSDKAAYQASGADNFVLVELEDHFVRRVYSDVTDGLGGDFMLVKDVNFDNSLSTEVYNVLAGVSTSKVEDDFFVWVRFWVLAKVIIVLDTVPYNTDCSEVF